MTDRRVVIDLNAVRHEADKKMELGALRYIVAMWALIPAMLTQEMRSAAERRVLDRAGLLYSEVLAAAAWAQFGREKGASTTEEREATRRRWLMTWPFIPGLLGKPPSSVVMVSQR